MLQYPTSPKKNAHNALWCNITLFMFVIFPAQGLRCLFSWWGALLSQALFMLTFQQLLWCPRREDFKLCSTKIAVEFSAFLSLLRFCLFILCRAYLQQVSEISCGNAFPYTEPVGHNSPAIFEITCKTNHSTVKIKICVLFNMDSPHETGLNFWSWLWSIYNWIWLNGTVVIGTSVECAISQYRYWFVHLFPDRMRTISIIAAIHILIKLISFDKATLKPCLMSLHVADTCAFSENRFVAFGNPFYFLFVCSP